MENYISTYTNRKINPVQPVAEDIVIEDIAHSLSLMTRANGHLTHFYSVAQHTINCYKEAKARGYSERVQLGCLLHDASESYISDITRPVKRQLVEYYVIEDRLQRMIYEKFGLTEITEEEHLLIKIVDDSLLFYEFIELMGISPSAKHAPEMEIEHDFSLRDFAEVENEFLSIFNQLTSGTRF
ncbi:MAG: phosphohydrolase [Clostridiales bacterium]|nr:phosphohydrolase [Clostridiales bacterium]